VAISARRVVLGAIGLAVVIQAYRPSRTNPPIDPKQEITAAMAVAPDVRPILSRSCDDCHSNRTVWPWYSEVAPISWGVISDVSDGRSHMDFSEWGTYPAYKRKDLLNDVCKMVTQHDMPLVTYALLHPNARLSEADRQAICRWTKQAVGGTTQGDSAGDETPSPSH
jgi:hypothetical protein